MYFFACNFSQYIFMLSTGHSFLLLRSIAIHCSFLADGHLAYFHIVFIRNNAGTLRFEHSHKSLCVDTCFHFSRGSTYKWNGLGHRLGPVSQPCRHLGE